MNAARWLPFLIGGLVMVAIGLAIIIGRAWAARFIAEANRRAFGLKLRNSSATMAFVGAMFLAMGTGAVVIAIVTAL
ncbi:hypothetical protein [Schumannella sp. 10F1B-5-1]|uniref:hypothetical protein n=1 Tax=Schumannella sp. 10F1B-5-1 TaxID=2590780 RepID=UPI0011314B9C|nr:hypothetical protein [Schumannella sp. 10F1B-5-1]TPW78323.1 hypothetical protein FJ658_00500 [Schumannella sp. 10F1B-5-1]